MACPTVDGVQYQITRMSSWRETLAIFEGRGEPGDALLRIFGESRVQSLAYRNDNLPARYGPLGRAGGHFGTFRICGRLVQGARLIMNIIARVRVESGPTEC